MVWAPAQAIITPRAIPGNLVGFCLDATRQREALDWALGASSAATYKLVKTYQNSIAEADKPVFPCIAFSDDDDAQDYTEDVIEAAYTCTLELSIQSNVPDTAVTQGRTYDKAFRSMIRNCPIATLIANANAIHAVLISMETGFLPIKAAEGGTSRNNFLQQVQIRVGYGLTRGEFI